jgi:hypothetical protein
MPRRRVMAYKGFVSRILDYEGFYARYEAPLLGILNVY